MLFISKLGRLAQLCYSASLGSKCGIAALDPGKHPRFAESPPKAADSSSRLGAKEGDSPLVQLTRAQTRCRAPDESKIPRINNQFDSQFSDPLARIAPDSCLLAARSAASCSGFVPAHPESASSVKFRTGMPGDSDGWNRRNRASHPARKKPLHIPPYIESGAERRSAMKKGGTATTIPPQIWASI